MNDISHSDPAPMTLIEIIKSRARTILLWLGPIVALGFAAYIYFSGGRYVSEEDANTSARTVLIAPEVAGRVVSRSVAEGQMVKAGDLLFSIDPVPYTIARDEAMSQLELAKNQIGVLKATYDLKVSAVNSADANLKLAEVNYVRAEDLYRKDAGSAANRDQAGANLAVSKAALEEAKANVEAALAQLGGDVSRPVDQQPSVQQAALVLRNAQRNLDLSQVRAPFDGKLSNVDALQIGAQLSVGKTALALVDVAEPWVVANLKETDLDGVAVGRPATVTIDAFPGVTWTGKVSVIGAATATTFAILPAQNTTGNWVKVVQRVPVRIDIEPNATAPEISAGLSSTVTIDTGRVRNLSSLFSGR